MAADLRVARGDGRRVGALRGVGALQHGDVDVALVFASGRASLGVDLRGTLTFQLDPYYLAPIGADYVSLAALQAQAVLARTGRSEKDLAEIVASAVTTRSAIRRPPYPARERRRVARGRLRGRAAAPEDDVGPPVDGAAAVVLVAGDRARQGCATARHGSRALITGLIRTTPACAIRRVRVRGTGGRAGGRRQRWSRGRRDHGRVQSRGAVIAEALGSATTCRSTPPAERWWPTPVMVTGLARIGEAFRQVADEGRQRTLGHASSGPCLQQNLVCVLEGRDS